MKKAFVFFILVATFSVAYSTSYSSDKPPIKASDVFLPIGKSSQMISMQDLAVIKLKDFEALTGKKLNLVNKIGFSIGQKQLRKSINPDGTFNKKKFEKFFDKYAEGSGGFHAGGFFLGLLLGLIGVLIAYLIKDDKKKNRVKWAWIGWVVWLVILAISLAA